ncbi:hypothetical protein TKV_c08220 [Thermoanaerobacter kivui]|uniref:Uncharacterized protein n=1 Tax=Thermoanaerobacter kivui TaxID=2325 RepID=A0A097AQ94_THEKI|nr:hypothetical protein [Thermoanaerobacter kivui]AIS52004.1 hypothetical protein TKV_c08220 [Thermoanaerobacter kivui]
MGRCIKGGSWPGEALGRMFITFPVFGWFALIVFTLLGGIIFVALLSLISNWMAYLIVKLAKTKIKPFNKVATLKKIIMVGLLWGITGIFARASIGDFRGGFTSESIGEELIKYGGFTWPMSHVIGTIIPILWPPAGVRGRIMLHDFFTVPLRHISRLPYSVGIDLAIWTIGLISWIVMGGRGPGEAIGKMFIAYPCFGVFVFVIFVLLGGIITAGLFYLIMCGVGYLLKKLSKATE